MKKVKNMEKGKAENSLKGKKKIDVKEWEKPSLEDVSGKIMAQPYIRFT